MVYWYKKVPLRAIPREADPWRDASRVVVVAPPPPPRPPHASGRAASLLAVLLGLALLYVALFRDSPSLDALVSSRSREVEAALRRHRERERAEARRRDGALDAAGAAPAGGPGASDGFDLSAAIASIAGGLRGAAGGAWLGSGGGSGSGSGSSTHSSGWLYSSSSSTPSSLGGATCTAGGGAWEGVPFEGGSVSLRVSLPGALRRCERAAVAVYAVGGADALSPGARARLRAALSVELLSYTNRGALPPKTPPWLVDKATVASLPRCAGMGPGAPDASPAELARLALGPRDVHAAAEAAAGAPVDGACRRHERVLPLRAPPAGGAWGGEVAGGDIAAAAAAAAAPDATAAAAMAADAAAAAALAAGVEPPRAGEALIGVAYFTPDTSSPAFHALLRALPPGTTALDVARSRAAHVPPGAPAAASPPALACHVTPLQRADEGGGNAGCAAPRPPALDPRPYLPGPYSRECLPLLHLPVPLAEHFDVVLAPAADDEEEEEGEGGAEGAPAAPPPPPPPPPPLPLPAFAVPFLRVDSRQAVRVLLAPSPEALAQFPDAARHAAFFGRVSSADRLVELEFEPGFPFDEAAGGYLARAAVREAGAYAVDVHVAEYYGDDYSAPPSAERGPNEPPAPGAAWEGDLPDDRPLVTGPFAQRAADNHCSNARSLAGGSGAGVLLVVPPAPPAPAPAVWGDARCTDEGATGPGRWVRLSPGEHCAPPACAGPRDYVSAMDWNGAARSWVWAPYACHVRVLTSTELARCADDAGVRWLLVMGDSPVREVFGNLLRLNRTTERLGKWDSIDARSVPAPLRATFQFWHASFFKSADLIALRGGPAARPWAVDETYLAHFNVLPSPESGAPWAAAPGGGGGAAPHERLPPEASALHSAYDHEPEADRPDVFLANGGHVYQTLQHDEETVAAFSARFAGAVAGARAGRPELGAKGKPMAAWYYHSPAVFGAPHAGALPVSLARHSKFAAVERAAARAAGLPALDARRVTAARWEDSFDGVHYLRGANGEWHGLTSGWLFMAVLNAILGECPSLPPWTPPSEPWRVDPENYGW